MPRETGNAAWNVRRSAAKRSKKKELELSHFGVKQYYEIAKCALQVRPREHVAWRRIGERCKGSQMTKRGFVALKLVENIGNRY